MTEKRLEYLKLTFKGGIHPKGKKALAKDKQTVTMDTPSILAVPLLQHIGAPCESMVKVGDTVKMGQKIADSEAFVSVPVHAPVSGTVKAIEKKPHATMGECMCVIIENDNEYTQDESIKPLDYTKMESEEIISAIREFGIAGMGGATFPSFIKLKVPPEKKVDTILINGAECEPYLTSDYRLMLEEPENIIEGAKILMKATNVKNVIIATEDNKSDAADVLDKLCKSEDGIKVVTVKTKYPQGSEKQLIDAVLKREVKAGTLPADSGVIVQNTATVAQIYRSFKTGLPLIDRIVTVSGDGIENPMNIRAKIGSSYKDLCDFAGGVKENAVKVISGGPMMGFAQHTLEVPVTKGTSGILCFSEKENKEYEEKDCIKCGRCVNHCPIKLMPFMITEYARINDMDNALRYGLKDCIECGTCSFVCPQRRHLVQSIRLAKLKSGGKK